MKLKFIILTIIGLFSFSSFAQEEISPERKQAIDSLALEKVKDLSKYISIIGSKETPWSEANRVIERAEDLFMTGSEIGVSSIYLWVKTAYGFEAAFLSAPLPYPNLFIASSLNLRSSFSLILALITIPHQKDIWPCVKMNFLSNHNFPAYG